MDPMGNDSLESDGKDTTKNTILENKMENFLGSLLDAIGEIRRTRPARLLACETTLLRALVQAFGNLVQQLCSAGGVLLLLVQNVLTPRGDLMNNPSLCVRQCCLRRYQCGPQDRILP
jgi:hypothetical protein